MTADSRRVALEILARVEDDGAFANLVVKQVLDRRDLSAQDRGFVTDLVYGTIRRRRACDHLVDRFLSAEPPAAARRSLRLGVYQAVFRDDIPAYAAVSETVAASPKRFRGLVNAVLRKVVAGPVEFPDDATRLSYPDWIVRELRESLGDDLAAGALEQMNKPAAATTRSDGYTQDLASQWVVAALEASEGELIFDACAAPGGKATGLAKSGATVLAGDLQAHRAGLVAANARQYGSGRVLSLVADASTPPFREATFDRVLLDAPCSGLGVLRRRPDARWRIGLDDVEKLAMLQVRLVDSVLPTLRDDGVFVYSVCTLTRSETLGIDEHIAANHPDLVPLDPPGAPWVKWGRGAMLLPQERGTDGMALFRYRYSRPNPDATDVEHGT